MKVTKIIISPEIIKNDPFKYDSSFLNKILVTNAKEKYKRAIVELNIKLKILFMFQ